MKSLQIIIYILFSLLIIGLFGNLILSSIAILLNKDLLHLGHFINEGSPFFIKIFFILKIASVLPLTLGIFYLIRVVFALSKHNYFSQQIVRYFRLSGWLIFSSGCLGFLLGFSFLFVTLGVVEIPFNYVSYLNFDSRGLYLLFAIMGLLFIMFSKIVSKGNQLQQENDLTI